MKKYISYIIVGVASALVGVGAMGILVYLFPNEVVKTITERDVNVTDTGIAESVLNVKDAVVVVQNYQGNTLYGTGTGFVYDTDDDNAYIMTNHHVIDDADSITITYSDDSEASAEIVGSDEYADIAVLKVDKDSIKAVAKIGSSESTRVGDTVFTIGSPMGIDYRGTVTRGILSGKDRLVSVSVGGSSADWIMNVMQTDAAINPGNSGGPLCNINGDVIGINSLKIVEDTVEGIGFAIPIEDAVNYANDLRNGGKISRPYIGVSMLNVSNTFALLREGIRIDRNIESGVVIAGVENNSPAKDANLQVGDVIVEIEGKKISDIAEFRYTLYSYSIGEEIKLKIIRGDDEKIVKVKLAG